LISLRFDQLAQITGGTLHNVAKASERFTGVSIDSRTLRPGELFIAIRGARHDGHDYIEGAVNAGAGGVIVETTFSTTGDLAARVGVVTVANSHQAMLALARRYRDSGRTKYVGITGSNGKTTTKELAFHLISAVEKDVYRSPGNLNNLYGAPLALLAMPQDTRVAIMEMGISTREEMPVLADMVRPDVVVITNVGPSHLEFMKSVEGVAQAKLELVRRSAPEVPVIINADDPVLMTEARKVRDRFTTFGIDRDADYLPEIIEHDAAGALRVTIKGHVFKLPLVGRHQVYNLLAAYAAFEALGYSFADRDTGAVALDTAPMRGQLIKRGHVTVFADCYNANPESMKAGLKAFFEIPSRARRVVILGDMLELGQDAPRYHDELGRTLGAYSFDLAILVGQLSKRIAAALPASGVAAERVRVFEKTQDAARAIAALVKPGDLVMVKASHGMGLEAVIEAMSSPEGRV
jgi:UDP-N-acetylmuramoyl-tripeptide--D-alanyl-D-alanine ligase